MKRWLVVLLILGIFTYVTCDSEGGDEDEDEEENEDEEEGDDDEDDDEEEDDEEEGDDDEDDDEEEDDEKEDDEEDEEEEDKENEDEEEGESEGGDEHDDTSEGDEMIYKPLKRCKKGGKSWVVGENFTDPSNPCRECRCCKTGVKCRKKECTTETPPCGVDHYESPGDECCPVCSDYCNNKAKTNYFCRNKVCSGIAVAYYPDNKCCKKCGCYTRGVIVPIGPITGFPHGECEECTCQSNGEVICKVHVSCPTEKLRCVDPVVRLVDGVCKWDCPNGQTCYRGKEVIRPNEHKIIGDKVCICYQESGYFYPLAMCANTNHWGSYEKRMYKDMCIKRPAAPMYWD